MTPPLLTLEPLTKAAFAPFGTVIETEGAPRLPINQGTTTRFDALAAIDAAHGGGSPIISLFRGTRRSDPIAIRLLERHPLGSQAFYPLVDAEWLVVVAPNIDMGTDMGNDMNTDQGPHHYNNHDNNHDNNEGTHQATSPDFASLRCFLASGTQGVSYAPGTWHHPLLVLLPEQDFLVVDRAAPVDEAPGQNLDEVWFDGPDGIAALLPEIKAEMKAKRN
jgi:ureidoglycolate lyase